MSDELKPCPFCGGKPTYDRNFVICETCAVRMERAIVYPRWHEVEELSRRWNARAERTCRWVPFEEGHSIAGPGWRCSECGLELGPENVFVVEQCYCCPECQSKVVDE